MVVYARMIWSPFWAAACPEVCIVDNLLSHMGNTTSTKYYISSWKKCSLDYNFFSISKYICTDPCFISMGRPISCAVLVNTFINSVICNTMYSSYWTRYLELCRSALAFERNSFISWLSPWPVIIIWKPVLLLTSRSKAVVTEVNAFVLGLQTLPDILSNREGFVAEHSQASVPKKQIRCFPS